ncbi:Ribose-5-phosphate isomerase A [Posidoniimonas corsicana]|uniref:Ribose-5-phosphate isomerase A n=1 Tax=Posidoniimonas corsicana TaxID=1938618 RepID=A0A5C5UTQ7_9BACT|nr:ribose-5-phosphate isomerase RpiA [Posidoniimonas corsicana]TWT29616.1 Ribose-5-phosphate isomerase A [Posidoniimonas corsicana]
MSELASEKLLAAQAAVKQLADGMIVGLGSGSTSALAIREIGAAVEQGLDIIGIPTSVASEELARELGIPLTTLDEYPVLDTTIDGADRFNDQLELIKGGGGALLREKIVAAASKRFVVIADSTKHANPLGGFPIPVEVIPFGVQTVLHRLEELKLNPVVRQTDAGAPYITDENNLIVDLRVDTVADPKQLAEQLVIPGVVEHGLFIGLADEVLMGVGGDVQRFVKA